METVVHTATGASGSVPPGGHVFVASQQAVGLQRARLGNPGTPGRQVLAEPAERVTNTLKLHTSNRLESLAECLAEALRTPLHAPLQPEVIMVQSQGMARWLKLQLAERHSVCANYSFPFP